MGAGCYKEKPLTISKDAIIKAINERYLSETILTETINNPKLPQNKAQGTQAQKTMTGSAAGVKGNKIVPVSANTEPS